MMDPSTALSDTSAKSAFSIGGLMSQINNLLGGTSSESDIFSTLLSQDSPIQTALASQTSSASVTATPASTTVDLSSSSTNPDSLSQTLNNLSDALHQAIASLRYSHHTASSASASTSSTDQTTTATAASTSDSTGAVISKNHGKGKQAATDQSESQTNAATTTSDGTTTSTSDATQSTSSTPATPDAQSLAAILAELLLLVQTVVKDLKTASSTQTATGVQGGDQLVVKTDPLTKAEQALADALTALTANKSGDAGTDQAKANQDSTNLADTSTDPLQRLLELIQKDMAQVATAASATTQSSTASSVQASTAVTIESATQLATLETQIKTVLSLLQHSKSITSDTSPTTSDATTTATTDTAKTVPLASAAAVSLSASQISTAVTASVVTPPTGTSTQAPLFVSSNMSASYAGTAGGSDSDAGQDMLAKDGAPQTSGGNINNNLAAQNAQSTGANSFANQLSAARATTALTTTPSAVIDQVILQLNRGVKNGNDQMSLQLHPADLGKITVKLDMSADGKVQGTVTADNPATLQLLQKDSRSLERALQDAGLRADPGSLQFSLGGGSDGQSGQTAQGNGSGTADADGTVSASDSLDGDSGLVDLGSIAETYYVTPNGVNIRV